MEEKKTVVGVLAIVKNDNKFLLTKRHSKKRFEGGKWGFVGETVKFNEDPIGCLRRGLKEEVNLELESWQLFNIYSILFEIPNFKKHVILITYICGTKNNNVRINDEAEDFGWFELKEMEKLEMIKGNEKIVKDLIQNYL